MESLLPKLRVTATGLDLFTLFPGMKDIRLEIGFGYGEHLAAQAHAHPRTGFLGCEPYLNGIADLLVEIDRLDLHNIRLFPGDGREVLAVLPDASLARVDILFPDPWPKSRHHKRRLINHETLAMLARVLRPGGELRLATDHPNYAAWMLEHLLQHRDAFRWQAEGPDDFRLPPPDWVETRYQRKARAEGREPVWLRCVRL